MTELLKNISSKQTDLILICGSPPLTDNEKELLQQAKLRHTAISVNHHHPDTEYCLFHDSFLYKDFLNHRSHQKLISWDLYIPDVVKDKIHYLYKKATDKPRKGQDGYLFFWGDSFIPAIDYACYLGFKKALLIIDNTRGESETLKQKVSLFSEYIELYKYSDRSNLDLPVLDLSNI